MAEKKNKLIYGDNIEVMRKYIGNETVDLVYIDPPFNSKRNYNQIYNNIDNEDKAQAHAFVDTWTWDDAAIQGIEDIISNKSGVFTTRSIDLILGLRNVLGKGDLLSYLVSMTLRIAEIYRVLKPNGSFYLHCDTTASHYLKLVCDSIFCARSGVFRNEIVWCYRKWSIAQSQFVKNHDVILFYTKSTANTFNITYVPLSKGTMKRWNGKKQQAVFDESGVRAASNLTEESKGSPTPDWWDISIINPAAKERLGYPTQKPEALLERIINASSNEGDLVLDAYCGCGTTVAVSQRLNRRWIGIDITYQSISLILKRLGDCFGSSVLQEIELKGVPKDLNSAIALANKSDDKVRKEFEKWAVLTFSNNYATINEKKGGDGGIDGVAYISDLDDNNRMTTKKILFSVKSNKVLTPSVVRDLNGTVDRENAVMGYLLTLYPMDNLVRESKKYGKYDNKYGYSHSKITVISVNDILEGKRLNLPMSKEVLKSAPRKEKPEDGKQGILEL